ncbi:DUF4817 domain-containing protein [Trichonephila clavipes]|nr:DUF4817 domain-containing protein [Trichonephila clavipes]
MSSSLVPLKTHRAVRRYALNLLELKRPPAESRRGMLRKSEDRLPTQLPSLTLDPRSKLFIEANWLICSISLHATGPRLKPRVGTRDKVNTPETPYVPIVIRWISERVKRFVEWAQNEIAVVPDFHKRILFSDKAHFWLNGYVNKQNCRIWSEANPQVSVETPLHPEKLTVWCALWVGGITGPYFFKNDEGHNVTVNGDRYRALITNFFIPELNNHDVQELWFQQDDATCHTARATITLLKDTIGDRLISRIGPVNWPPRSCDLTPLDYFLCHWSMRINHKRLTIWKTTIAVLLPIYDHNCWKKSSKIGRPDWTTSEPAVAVLCQKSYLKCNATRLSFE